MTASVLLYVNHVEVGGDMEWDMSTEEVLGGVGRATLTIQSRDNSYEPQPHWDVKAVLNTGPLAGWVLWRGEIIRPPIELPVGFPFRRWKIDCADYNNEFDWRLVGALDGKTWLDTSGLGVFVNIDPYASSLKTDKLTVQNLLDHYIRVDGTAFDTTTFVQEYLSDFMTLTWNYSKLRTALEQLAAFIVGNLQFWGDPDLKFHWVTIPPWQDLAQELAAQSLDATAELSALMIAEGSVEGLAFAPFKLSDLEGNPDGTIGFRELKIDPDGSEMPQQVYVRGGTGYVYNAPPIPAVNETKTVVHDPVPGTEGTYQLYITENNTKLWHVDGTGYVSVTYEFADIGGPWPVKWVSVPWSESRNKGGNYWKFLSGPHVGLLADDNTNYLNFYGGIRVEFTPSITAGDPQIGTGGSGWVNETPQDRNKRQAYLDAPISTTKALRDSFGGQAIYRGKFPTLRGSVVTGHKPDRTPADGWRVGQLMKLTDARLPSRYNGKYFIIQRVRTKLLAFQAFREYTLDFGDGPASRYSYRSSKPFDAGWPPPANQINVTAYDLSPGPNSTQTITAQLVNGAGEPWNIPGKVVEWSLECYTNTGVLIASGSLSPKVSITDAHGTAYTKLTSGAGTNLVYFVFAAVRAV